MQWYQTRAVDIVWRTITIVPYSDRMIIPDAVGESEAELDLILEQLIGPIKNKAEIMVGDDGWNILTFSTER